MSGDGQQVIAWQIGDEEAAPGGDLLAEDGGGVAVRRHRDLDQLILVAEEAAGGLVVFDRQPRAPDAGVLHHRVNEGQRHARLHGARQENDSSEGTRDGTECDRTYRTRWVLFRQKKKKK